MLVNAAFALAVRDNAIKSNPCVGAITEIKKHAGKPQHKKALTLEDQRTFLKELENPEYSSYKNFFIVMFGTGVRVGELIGLRWCDVYFEKSEISINHNITYYRRLESKGNRTSQLLYQAL